MNALLATSMGDLQKKLPKYSKFLNVFSLLGLSILVVPLGLRGRVKFSLGVTVSGMIRVTVDVRVMVRVSNLLGSD